VKIRFHFTGCSVVIFPHFGEVKVRISNEIPTALTEPFCGFPPFLQVIAREVPRTESESFLPHHFQLIITLINPPHYSVYLVLLLLLLALQTTVAFSLLSDFLPFCSFFSYYHICVLIT
jgi:hypothetical protein